MEGIEDGILAEIAMQYNDGYIPSIYSFCNNINTMEGGTHEDGFRLALTRIINAYAREQGMIKKDETLAGDDVREGLTAIMKDRQRRSWETQRYEKLFPVYWVNSWIVSSWRIRKQQRLL